MGLEKIIAVSGKPGLFELLAQSKSGFVLKEIESGRKITLSAQNNVLMLSNVAVFTDEEDKPLEEILVTIYKRENGGLAISFKEDAADLFSYFSEIVPNYNKEKVYHSDLKKIFKWYEILHKADLLKDLIKVEEPETPPVEEEKIKKKSTKKVTKTKKKNE